MKKLLLVLCLMCLIVSISTAQDYSPFIYDNTSLFQFEDRIEALKEKPYTNPITDHRGYTIPLFKNWSSTTQENCITNNGATWAGPKYTKGFTTNFDGNHYFFNQYEEEITFNLLKDVGGTWKMYTYANGNYIEATISNKEQLTFLELTDSVKTISLQLKNVSGTNIADPVNDIVYKVSKHYGFIQLTRFLYFPTPHTEIGHLIGLTSPKKGVQLINSRDIFNFNIGDEFHYDSLNYNTDFSNEIHRIKTINIVTDIYRSSNTDTVIYTFDQQKETYLQMIGSNERTHEYARENVQQKYILSQTQLYPSQANLNTEHFLNNSSYWLTLFSDDTSRSVWNANGVWYRQDMNDPECWNEILFDPLRSYLYLEG